MTTQSQIAKTEPLKMVGSTKFGRYPKISIEQTYNMIESDDWLVDYAGYKKVATIGGTGRGIFASARLGKMVVVVDNLVYTVGTNLIPSLVNNGQLETFSGDVFIDGDIQNHIGICDKKDIWIYNYDPSTTSFTKATTGSGALDFTPGYIAFHNGRFLSVDINGVQWRLSEPPNTDFPNDSAHVGSFQTKADSPVAIFRFPGRSNLIFVMGKNITEPWYDLGLQLFPYQKNTSYNIDYGTNPATVAFDDQIVVWLGLNEKSGPVIMWTEGEKIHSISTDGIDFKLASLTNPQNAYAFLFKQDGHTFYQITFPDDNLTYIYDFKLGQFYTLSDPYLNYHIAKRCVYFNNKYYFISFKDGDLYELSSQYTDADGAAIPRIRIPPTYRLPRSDPFIVNNISFPIEQGNPQNNVGANLPRVDLSISTDGGESFSNNVGMNLNSIGQRASSFTYWSLGWSNELTTQFRFWGNGRYVVGNGTMDVYR